MAGPNLVPRTGVFYIDAVTQLTSSTYTFTGKYEDYTGFSAAADVVAGWVVLPAVYYNGYPIAGLYARYTVTAKTVITSGSNNLSLTVAWDATQKDTTDSYYPIAGTACVLTAVTPTFGMAMPTPYRDASANGVRLAYDALPAVQNMDKINIIDVQWGATGPTGPVGLSAYSVGV